MRRAAGSGKRDDLYECGDRSDDSHELWHYDDELHVQHLVRLIALCKSCHLVKHYGYARVKGLEAQARQHLMRINGWTEAQAKQHYDQVRTVWNERNKHMWTQNVNVLRQYGVDV